ncbi:uncharacterized protein FFB20_09649 [Fusarium fujikuroi]|uniref:Uncharacterized protein n=1 Tax=Gibberella fujikuroi (strain CBS 195.34 / IMI 58289 / NRRL A-6831) TaxID=1279085 RepID=S0DL72_GIBF5|nr:uncharacterized protein FFUJ_00222 [Fusarium fujikuroi IMI 58289]KLP05230.1 uncharacterized protein LW94_6013 [Fusarium fujikuroi]KLP06130.1 uncharacterized protein Y057_3125 [Fusarium fujikuroi]CCT63156.1 uncharacterized protein FFUJ_00222 [Fusarium fujikuroi IMI 58289]SCN66108.1 uncharacterized protein FFE2_00269 [Fusarium fujikuroi]SCN69039.1 uncharacterized protein FFC1_00264 [Fusarium fujikuroi]
MSEPRTTHPRHMHWTCPFCPIDDCNVSVNATTCPDCGYRLHSWRPDTGLPLIEALDANGYTIGELQYSNGVFSWDYINATVTTGPTMNDTSADLEARYGGRTNGTTTNGATTNGGTTYEDTADEDTEYAGRTNGGTTNGTRTNGSTTNGARTNGTRTNGRTTNGNQGRR